MVAVHPQTLFEVLHLSMRLVGAIVVCKDFQECGKFATMSQWALVSTLWAWLPANQETVIASDTHKLGVTALSCLETSTG